MLPFNISILKTTLKIALIALVVLAAVTACAAPSPPATLVPTATPEPTATAIVLMHDGGGDRSQTVEALETVLEALSNQGYVFEVVCP